MPGKARAGTADPIDPTTQFELDFVNAPIRDIVGLMADITEKEFHSHRRTQRRDHHYLSQACES